MKNKWLKISSILALAICLGLAWLNFSGRLSAGSFKLWFLIVSLVYFVTATLSVGKKSGA
ncbi:MAG: hypothetical protein ACPLZD_08735 [Candidatus Saccharicenans sp.]|nr:MAG: hypothetical protein C0168_08740 [Candidatus Aminicenantes bacterium]HEK85732.1 hypothetical protein [Candidatus Aminicenantes bacterium]